jgi:hypothetical protein
LAISAAVAFTAVNAAEKEIILHDSIHDYADDASGSFKDTSTRFVHYDVEIVLDEAYHDYESSAVAAFESTEGDRERAEFAAFEKSSFNVPWELSVVD